MDNKYSQDEYISCYLSDYKHFMRPSAFLDFAQHLAVVAADSAGFGDGAISKLNYAWILARMQVRFERPVRHEETVKMLTWHKGVNGLYFIRDYQMIGSDGIVAVNSTSSWIIMDITERRVVRTEAIADILPAEPQSLEAAISDPAPKVVVPRGQAMELLGTHRVCFSDVDYNHHANNVKYTVWAMDALPDDLVYGHALKELTINFNKEARPGDTVELYHCKSGGAHIVEGRLGDHQVFIEKLLFA